MARGRALNIVREREEKMPVGRYELMQTRPSVPYRFEHIDFQ